MSGCSTSWLSSYPNGRHNPFLQRVGRLRYVSGRQHWRHHCWEALIVSGRIAQNRVIRSMDSWSHGLRNFTVMTAVVLSLSACGASKPAAPRTSKPPTGTVAKTTTTVPVTSPTTSSTIQPPTTTTTALTRCRSNQLVAHGGNVTGGSGFGDVVITLTNKSGVSCTLYGYPGIGMITSSGYAVAVNPTRATIGGPAFSNVPKQQVVLAPGADAYFGFTWWLGSCQPSGVLEVTPPNDRGYLTIPNSYIGSCYSAFSVTPVSRSAPGRSSKAGNSRTIIFKKIRIQTIRYIEP